MAISGSFRLPRSIRPLKYRIRFSLDLEHCTFLGDEVVILEVHEETSLVVMNAKGLDISAASIFQGESLSRITGEKIQLDAEHERLVLILDTLLKPGSAVLHVQFSGTINDHLRGLYRSSYILPDGTPRLMAVTDFEPTDARDAFPCWDEPDMKAVFEVTLFIPEDRIALSNTPIVRERAIGNGRKIVRFAETPPMSTYLVAFVVGDLECIEGQTRDGIAVRVWATPGKVAYGRFALEEGIRALEYFTDYFGIAYPLEKLDMVGIPDFASGAMENWGLITFREDCLLLDPERSSADSQQRVAIVVDHEIDHQWSGDLDSPAWWSDLWLNESFATFMSYKAIAALHPDWDIWTQHLCIDASPALMLDSLQTSHPIEASVEDPAEIEQIFDRISYCKGATIIRMLECFLGEEVFRRGINEYLRQHAYGNATTGDLWSALGTASGEDVSALMDQWTRQVGYPVIHAEQSFGGILTLRQEPFLLTREGTSSLKQDSRLWPVPVSAITRDGGISAFLLRSKREVCPPSFAASVLKLNAGQTGFYRVNYDAAWWEELRNAIADRSLPPTDRLGLQDDASALMRAGYVSPTLYLNLTEAYRNEDNFAVLKNIADTLGTIPRAVSQVGDMERSSNALANAFFHEPYYPVFEAWGRELFRSAVQGLGWRAAPHEGHLERLRRGTVLAFLGRLNEPEVLSTAVGFFARSLNDLNAIPPDLRSVVYAGAARCGDESTFRNLIKIAEEAGIAEKAGVLSALGQFRDPNIVERALAYSLSQKVRAQDTFWVFSGTASNPAARDVVWEFFKANWSELNRRYGGDRRMGYFVQAAIMNFTTEEKAREAEEFFAAHPIPNATMALAQQLEKIRANAKFLTRNRGELAEYFAQHATSI